MPRKNDVYLRLRLVATDFVIGFALGLVLVLGGGTKSGVWFGWDTIKIALVIAVLVALFGRRLWKLPALGSRLGRLPTEQKQDNRSTRKESLCHKGTPENTSADK